jgi:hypothetical protein
VSEGTHFFHSFLRILLFNDNWFGITNLLDLETFSASRRVLHAVCALWNDGDLAREAPLLSRESEID